ncbi:Rha family transcriptional regulator [Yersinia mollaretii]|uniref:Rha family transcriptional regulator n=1 Tax=Yersinia mollaretii TaxID=33060 RepID=UPI0011A85ADC|nr:Rha family transcriptional regulator [Yersinia mollaretii]
MTVLKIADHRSHVTLSSREIAKLTAKDHKQVIHDIWEMFNDLYGLMKDSLTFTHMKNQIVTIIEGGEVSFDTRGHVSSFRLDKPHVECLLTGYSALLRMKVIRRIYEIEDKYNHSVLPATYKEALLALVVAENVKEQLAAERDEAVETKAWIGERREATSMATASVAVREKNKLAERLGESKKYAAIIPVEKRMGLEFKWQPLRQWCRENSVEPHEVEDKRFGTVKSWPQAAWLAVYDIDLRKIF